MGRGRERRERKGYLACSPPQHPICLSEGEASPLVSPAPQLLVPAGNRSATGTEFSALLFSLLWSQSVQELVSLKRTRASTEVKVGGRGLVAYLCGGKRVWVVRFLRKTFWGCEG